MNRGDMVGGWQIWDSNPVVFDPQASAVHHKLPWMVASWPIYICYQALMCADDGQAASTWLLSWDSALSVS